jgi:hypothetical protein
MLSGTPGPRRAFSFALVDWKKVAEALFSDSSFVAAGKRRPAGFPLVMTFAGYLAPAFPIDASAPFHSLPSSVA